MNYALICNFCMAILVMSNIGLLSVMLLDIFTPVFNDMDDNDIGFRCMVTMACNGILCLFIIVTFVLSTRQGF